MGKQSVCDTCAFIHLEIDTYITVPVKKLSQQKNQNNKIARWGPIIIKIFLKNGF